MEKNSSQAYSVLLGLIKGRRSIRKYKTESVSRETIEKILDAASWAPSGKNLQNWRYFVLTGKKRDAYLKHSQKSWLGIKDNLKQKLKPSLYAFTERFFFTLGDAPVFIFCFTKNDPNERYLTSVGSVYMSVQNMLLAAESLGLGTCPMGAPLEIKDDITEFIGNEKIKGLELLCGFTLGYPDHIPPAAPRILDGRVTWFED